MGQRLLSAVEATQDPNRHEKFKAVSEFISLDAQGWIERTLNKYCSEIKPVEHELSGWEKYAKGLLF